MTEPKVTSATDAAGQNERLMELVEEISDRIRQGDLSRLRRTSDKVWARYGLKA